MKAKTSNTLERHDIFVSYSHKDRKWLQRLQVHLRPLECDKAVKHWDDTMLVAGRRWKVEIETVLASAKVAILLVSADFLASEFIVSRELPKLLSNARKSGAVILPIIISPCRFTEISTLAAFQAMNPPSRPLIKMTRCEQEELFVKTTQAIERALTRQSTVAS